MISAAGTRYTAIRYYIPQLQIFMGNKTGGSRKDGLVGICGNAGRRKAAGEGG